MENQNREMMYNIESPTEELTMRKLSAKWLHKISGEEYTLVENKKAAYGSHEIITLAPIKPTENNTTNITCSTINLYDEFEPINEKENEKS
jgi:hypothetical protein